MLRSAALPLLFVVLAGCGAAASASSSPASVTGPRARWTGRVSYEARVPTRRGASAQLELRPARLVIVEAVDSEGDVVARTATAADGTFSIEAPVSAQRLIVRARIEAPHDLAVTRDPLGRDEHRIELPLGSPSLFLEITATESSADGSAGAFHILDTELRGLEAVYAWTGRRLPPLFTYWGRGVTTSWSYFRGERPAGSGRFCLELLGGEADQQHSTDTDEHDEAIILHELGHFVMDRLSTDSSPGGNHPAGVLLDPGLAWEEGRATWFAAAVLGAPHYLDTIGLEPHGRLRVSHDIEAGSPGPRGVGSEQGVAEILWDLSDGSDGLPDVDDDGVALGPGPVLRAMMALREIDGAYPDISTFLGHVVANELAERPQLVGLLSQGGHPGSMIPTVGAVAWPRDVTLPGGTSGKIDGVSNPAPNGSPNRPDTGQDAVHAYRVHVGDDGWLAVQLQIFGTGRAADRQDLDIEVRDIRANLLASSRGETQVERVMERVPPGWYVIYVRDGGSGNQAGYELRVWTE